jgi:manganese oxidase
MSVCYCMQKYVLSVVMLMLAAGAASAQAPFPVAVANDNRVPSGTLANGVLTLHLNVVRAMFHPDRDGDPGIDVMVLQEDGRAPSVPAPLIRVPAGTEVRTTIRNSQKDSSVLVYGLSGARTLADTVRLLPGETRELVTHASTAGTFLYQLGWSHRTSRFGEDRMMTGAFVVDPPGALGKDRVLVLLQYMDSVRLKEFPGAVDEVLTINGKVWPFTERLEYDLGEAITWRVINGSYDVHPMHLHGTYFDVAARGTLSTDTLYSPAQQRRVFTERMVPLSTMTMTWKPERAGNWLFHCHLTFHVQPHPPLGEMKASDDHSMHALHGMGGLVLGTHIRGPVAADVDGRRKLRLQVDQHDSIPGDFVPAFTYSLTETRGRPDRAGPTIVAQRGQPLAITVVNRASQPTAVHWHGLEIESYYDGVVGFGGTPQRVTPVIAANDSFVVKMTPPRAGTFIYHSHFDEIRQQGGGLYGAFIVADETYNADRDVAVVFSTARDTITPGLLINGSRTSLVRMKAGETYRLRFINITLARASMRVGIMKGAEPETWQPLAKDGIELSSDLRVRGLANRQLSIGDTFDALFTPSAAGEYEIVGMTGNGTRVMGARVIVE